jgi:hypothetical protein
MKPSRAAKSNSRHWLAAPTASLSSHSTRKVHSPSPCCRQADVAFGSQNYPWVSTTRSV